MAEEKKGIVAVVSGGDHDSLMAAISPYRILAMYGNMDEDCDEWLFATIVLPRASSALLQRSLQEDYHLNVTLVEGREGAEAFVKSHPSWD